MVAYRARPEEDTLLPVVLVVQEIFRDICRRLAKEGYLAIAPICSPGKAMCPRWKIIAKRASLSSVACISGVRDRLGL